MSIAADRACRSRVPLAVNLRQQGSSDHPKRSSANGRYPPFQ